VKFIDHDVNVHNRLLNPVELPPKR
jgi:hypothetical protein